MCACISVFVHWEGWKCQYAFAYLCILAADMWLRFEHRQVCETQHWRLSCKMRGRRVLYVPILCARANGRWKITGMSMHWVCVSRFTLPSLICPALWYRNQPPHLLKSVLSSPLSATYLQNIYLILSSHLLLRIPSGLFSQVSLQNSVCLLSLPMQATYVVVS
jgi:hypothetical protein